MKLGLDFHGVLDKYPEMFSILTKALVEKNSEIHIITGTKITSEFKKNLNNLGISYTHLFSIVDYHESIGTPVNYDEKGPWINSILWDRTKADYCDRVGIEYHIDDSKIYGKYFKKTRYILFQ